MISYIESKIQNKVKSERDPKKQTVNGWLQEGRGLGGQSTAEDKRAVTDKSRACNCSVRNTVSDAVINLCGDAWLPDLLWSSFQNICKYRIL